MVLRDGTVDSICEEEAQPKLAWSAGGSTCEEAFYVTSLPGLERAHRLGVTLIFPACPRTDLIFFQHDIVKPYHPRKIRVASLSPSQVTA